jgi:hypothetical protein
MGIVGVIIPERNAEVLEWNVAVKLIVVEAKL